MKQFEMATEIKPHMVDEKLYDICMIEQLCHGNQEQVKKMVRVFIEQVPKAVEEIKTAYVQGDFTTVRKKAHQIKPTLGYYAIIKLEKDIKLIEALAKAGLGIVELELKIRKLDEVITQVTEKMKNDFLPYQ